MNDDELRDLLIDHMGRGFLENIAALLRQEPELGRFIPSLAASDRLPVRIGAAALVEELARNGPDALAAAVPGLRALLRDANPTVRGDALALLGSIKGAAARSDIERMLGDENEAVRQVAQMVLDEMGA